MTARPRVGIIPIATRADAPIGEAAPVPEDTSMARRPCPLRVRETRVTQTASDLRQLVGALSALVAMRRSTHSSTASQSAGSCPAARHTPARSGEGTFGLGHSGLGGAVAPRPRPATSRRSVRALAGGSGMG